MWWRIQFWAITVRVGLESMRLANLVSWSWIEDSLDSLNKSNQQLSKRMDEKDTQIQQLERKVGTLEVKIDEMEQWGRRGSIRIHGLPKDTPGTVDEKVLRLINQDLELNPPLVLADIEVAHRLPRRRDATPYRPPSPQQAALQRSSASQEPGGEAGGVTADVAPKVPPEQVIVKFASRRCKARVMEVKKNLKKLHNLDFPLYIQDDLTPRRAKLTYQARQLKRNGKVSDTWVTENKIIVKDLRNKIHDIKSHSDLESFWIHRYIRTCDHIWCLPSKRLSHLSPTKWVTQCLFFFVSLHQFYAHVFSPLTVTLFSRNKMEIYTVMILMVIFWWNL